MNYQLSIGQSLFPSIDWIGFLSQEHSPGHGSIEWTISRSVQISIDPIELCRRRPRYGRWQGSNQWSDQDLMKEFNLPLPSLIQSVSGDARVMLKSRLVPGLVWTRSRLRCGQDFSTLGSHFAAISHHNFISFSQPRWWKNTLQLYPESG